MAAANETHAKPTMHRVVSAIFFLSGIAALIYQIVWQRTLFAIYGINVESVTIIVTVFMLGLGIGSLVGGRLSRQKAAPTMLIFAIFELLIGVIGVASLSIIHAVGMATLGFGPTAVAGITFAMLLLPTSLMGATLPLLVAHFTRLSKSVGASVSELYYVNTLGSAVASALSVLLLLPRLGQLGSVLVAAGINVCVALAAFRIHLHRPAR